MNRKIYRYLINSNEIKMSVLLFESGIHGPKPDRTKTNKIWKISDRTGPAKFRKPRTEPDQDLGPIRTDRSSDQAVRGSLLGHMNST